MANGQLLFFVPFAFNFNYFHIPFSTITMPSIPLSPVELPCHRHINFQIGPDLAIKKPAKKSFRVLTGTRYKRKRLCSTRLFSLL